ncbi:MORC family CW-type zinc finger protein 3-like isoform X2 [Tachysurus fulvidraco]|uniref:MORC family CW-type zinc finger protein 3-like isoform X2 n=1 Tax=Tachysurus fulvidraco TaxID=1234273 RepID=UPI001FEEAE1B|nr:MORC family CW-type zinc finger protein 3-like isoform X2 [Tachysurus fulvidraco]
MKDPYDIRIPIDVYENTREPKNQQNQTCMSVPESEYSLRAYSSILYLKPRMQIIIQGQKVETQFVTKSLAKVLKDTYKPRNYNKKITITFGYNTKTKEHYGIMMYNKNRLIKAYECVACQRRANSTGVGVIGVIECNHLKPTHNKQDFDSTDEYRRIMLNVGYKLEEYWKEVRFKHQKNLNCTEPIENIVTKRALGHSQGTMEIKKVRRKGSVDSIPDSVLTSTASPGMCNSGNDANEAESEIAPMDNSDDHSKVQQKQINHITQTSSEDQLNDKVLYLKAMVEIKQLQQKLLEQEKAEKELMGKVDVLEADKYTLSTCCNSLQKDLEDIKRENKKVKLSGKGQSVQTDFPIASTEESATTSTEASDLRRGIDLQFGTQDRRGSGQENNNTQLCRLRELRESVGRLLATLVPALDLQQVNHDSEDIDEILNQVINQISMTEAAST